MRTVFLSIALNFFSTQNMQVLSHTVQKLKEHNVRS